MEERVKPMRKYMRCVVVSTLLVGVAQTALAGQHTWDVNEVFSDTTGNIQFVELVEANGTPGEVNINGVTVTSTGESFPIGGSPVAPPTSNKFFLIATPAFAALPGAPTPDRILPAGNIPFFSTSGDTVSYGPYDSWAFGTVPTNGTTSLNRSGGPLLNSPTNYAGTSGSVNAGGPTSIPVPALSGLSLGLAAGLLLLAGAAVVFRSRR
jgi:hypothetical protein